MESPESSQATFQKLKVDCVPLLGNSLLTPESIPLVSKLLSNITATLRETRSSGHALTPSLISYVFFPISSILRRNSVSTVPNQTLEKVMVILSILCEDWWWDFDGKTWEQIFMLCGAIIGDLGDTGTVKTRDDETKDAAALCLWSLVRERNPGDDPSGSTHTQRAERQSSRFQTYAQTLTFIPILGQTVNSLLGTAASKHLPLQRSSLRLLHVLVRDYLPDDFVPSIMPGIVSAMDKIALNTGGSKGWARGEIVSGALTVMQETIIRSIGDEICVKQGAVAAVDDLEDLAELLAESKSQPETTPPSPYLTPRTPAWVRGTASQLHIAINSLTPLVNHPTSSALLALSTFSAVVVSGISLTVPQSQPLLMSFLLSLSGSIFEGVSRRADAELREVLTPPSSVRHSLLQVLVQLSKDNLAALPRLIPSHSDDKVEHVANLIEGVCRLAISQDSTDVQGITSISVGVGKLLGPNGGIEKWGWSLLSVLEFATMSVAETRNTAVLMLESSSMAVDWIPFPELVFKHITSRTTYSALERMFRSLGRAAGEDCLFTVEWFMSVGESGTDQRAVAALWCTCRLLEGAAEVSLDPNHSGSSRVIKRSRRFERLARGIARRVADLWMDIDEDHQSDEGEDDMKTAVDEPILVEHVKGLVPIRATVDFRPTPKSRSSPSTPQPHLHKCLCLQLLSVTAGILEARFSPLLLHTLYPILNAIVSESPLVSTSGLAALYSITSSASYASPANLLLSNFDYVLDAVSRHLSRRWLDVDATKVLVILVRQVGRDVVQKAGDVVEECFDRLDEFHGYEVIVDGLVEVLGEVVKVIEDDSEVHLTRDARTAPTAQSTRAGNAMDVFLHWYVHRQDAPQETTEGMRDSSYPREAWDSNNVTEPEQTTQEQDHHIDSEPPPTPAQALTRQIVSRSIYFLTHSSPVIRARILLLLSSAVPVLPESALLPSIHNAWPFILNRFTDPEPFVVSAAASLVESLAAYVGDFMYRRIWDDIWPRFRTILKKLEAADTTNALARLGPGAVGTESAYTYSHRLYRSLLKTMTAAARGVQGQDSAIWEALLLFRRFLHRDAHEELQACARELYIAFGANNEDAVWFALSATQGQLAGVTFLEEAKWDISQNATLILLRLGMRKSSGEQILTPG
ncbi:armadillo-type protein [Sparassis latifolia]